MPEEKNNPEEHKKKLLVVEEVEVEQQPDSENKLPENQKEVGSDNSDLDLESETVHEVGLASESKQVESQDTTLSDEDVDKPNYLWIIVPTALLVGALVGGLITYFSAVSNVNVSETPAPSSAEQTATPEPTTDPETVSFDRSSVKVQVLNGSGISGLAGKAKTYLEGLGYEDVAVGNASTSDFETTELRLKVAVKEYETVIKSDLEDNYELSEDIATLPSSSGFDIIIVLGKK